jgi:hypothetical protein
MASEGRAEWRVGPYEEIVNPPRDAINELENQTGTRKFATFLGVPRRNNLKRGVFTLNFRVREHANSTRISALEWWAPETPVPSTAKAWKNYVIWFARRRIPVGARPPFNALEPRFRRALAATINDSGGLRLFERSSKPTQAFLERLKRHYEGEDI